MGTMPAPISVWLIAGALVSIPAHAQAPQGPHDHAAKPNSLPDQNATQEPSAKGAPPSQPAQSQAAGAAAGVFLNGSLNLPDGDQDSQTSPAKFSRNNDALDKIPIMARGPVLSDQDRTTILANVKINAAAQPGLGGPASELPTGMEASDWPPGVMAQVPNLKDTKYVALADRVLIVRPANGIVIAEIRK
jgi:hypothetical protein